jgi:hypothetical protein
MKKLGLLLAEAFNGIPTPSVQGVMKLKKVAYWGFVKSDQEHHMRPFIYVSS